MSVTNLAGLLIYRIAPRKPIEYLLLNDSFEHHKHWYPPKGKKVGDEDELKCALRETLDLTGLGSNDLVTDQAFRAELKYVDGIKPKQVVYFLARMAPSSRHNPIRCDTAGIKYQWCTLDNALSKVLFQSMQDVLTQAEDYIEGIRDEILFSNSWQTVGRDNGNRMRRNDSNQDDNRNSYRRFNNRRFDNSDDEGSGGGNWKGGGSRGEGDSMEWRFKKMSMNDSQQQQYQRGGRRGMNDRDYSRHYQEPYQQQGRWSDGPTGSSYNNNNSNSMQSAFSHQQQQQQQRQQRSRPQDNPLYKTKLCEKFERDGECPYYQKCVFAHGPSELRVRETTPNTTTGNYSKPPGFEDRGRGSSSGNFIQQSTIPPPNMSSTGSYHHHQQQQHHQRNTNLKYEENPLYKTRLCQRYSEHGQCPYGEKCQFAHGEQELRTAPEQQTPQTAKSMQDASYSAHHSVVAQSNSPPDAYDSRNGDNSVSGQTQQPWRRTGVYETTKERNLHANTPRLVRNISWSNTGARLIGESPTVSDDGDSIDSPSYLPSAPSPMLMMKDTKAAADYGAPLVTPAAQKLHNQSNTSNKGDNGNGGEKPWLKVVEVTDQELEHMTSPISDSGTGIGSDPATKNAKLANKAAELENRLTRELIDFMAKRSQTGGNQAANKMPILKEITQLEFRNSLSKQQMLNVVVSALFGPCKAVGISDAISKNADLLAKVVSKQQDQTLMLNAWVRVIAEDENTALWQKKAPEVLGALYKESLLDEDVFTSWFASKQQHTSHDDSCSAAISSMRPFAHWLATAEEE